MKPIATLNSTRRPAYECPNGRFETTSPDVETSQPTGSGDQLHEPALSSATINDRPASPVFSATNSSDMSLERTSDCSSESNSDPDDASMLSDQSDESSAKDDPESMETETEIERQEPQPNQASLRQQNASPYRRSFPGKGYRMQLMNDHDIRSRMLDRREASLGHREKWLKRTFSEAHQLERRQPVRDPPSVGRCTCRCAIKEKKKREAA
ncbi:hypothetical protein PENNAL_c0004G03291 [Penicillium nalgiovense]|uniref:Uncharacterized protein n=1 Tax=Penicillium nalgiovense TaxID=60175 RepID=A0A1V6Z4H5_PENNA|nr:hypothetical protein PENNAL_c0004G03291 [Penicillium nalgiovense]